MITAIVFKIKIDGYYINCGETENAEYIGLKLNEKLIRVKPEERFTTVQIP